MLYDRLAHRSTLEPLQQLRMSTECSVHFPAHPNLIRGTDATWLLVLVVPQSRLKIWDEVTLNSLDSADQGREGEDERDVPEALSLDIERTANRSSEGPGSTACAVIRIAVEAVLGVAGRLSRSKDECISVVSTADLVGQIYFWPDRGEWSRESVPNKHILTHHSMFACKSAGTLCSRPRTAGAFRLKI